jgi:hypothetical protein
MSFNQVETLFLKEAIGKLEQQLIELGEWKKQGTLYLGMGVSFVVLSSGQLSILNGNEPRTDIVPVDCHNFYKAMCIAEAVSEYLDRQKNPENYQTPFFI